MTTKRIGGAAALGLAALLAGLPASVPGVMSVTAVMRLSGPHRLAQSAARPSGSQSRTTTSAPDRANSVASSATVVVLPDPPFAFATAMTAIGLPHAACSPPGLQRLLTKSRAFMKKVKESH